MHLTWITDYSVMQIIGGAFRTERMRERRFLLPSTPPCERSRYVYLSIIACVLLRFIAPFYGERYRMFRYNLSSTILAKDGRARTGCSDSSGPLNRSDRVARRLSGYSLWHA